MAKLAKEYVRHERIPKKTSQGNRKNVKKSSMNKSKKDRSNHIEDKENLIDVDR
jgi:hypothetical protein